MEAVIERGKDAPGIRLLQDAFHMRSLSLYASLGFDVTASCVVMSGTPRGRPRRGLDVRPLTESDLGECEALCQKVHGFTRTGALRDASQAFAPYVAVRDGRSWHTRPRSTSGRWRYGVAETEDDMKALLLGRAADGGAARDARAASFGLFRWALEQGLRAVKPMNLMARGAYQEPQGSWFPSVIY